MNLQTEQVIMEAPLGADTGPHSLEQEARGDPPGIIQCWSPAASLHILCPSLGFKTWDIKILETIQRATEIIKGLEIIAEAWKYI